MFSYFFYMAVFVALNGLLIHSLIRSLLCDGQIGAMRHPLWHLAGNTTISVQIRTGVATENCQGIKYGYGRDKRKEESKTRM